MDLYLIQRGRIRMPPADETKRLSEAVETDYMGSAEYEFGAMPDSLERIQARGSAYTLSTIADLDPMAPSPLYVYSPFSEADLQEYTQLLRKLRMSVPGEMRLKARSEFTLCERDVHTRGGRQSKRRNVKTHPYVPRLADFWWDILNDVMFSFEEPFMKQLPNYLAKSFQYIAEQNSRQKMIDSIEKRAAATAGK